MRRVLILLLSVAACSDPATARDDFEARVSSPHAWSGGSVEIVSTDFGDSALPDVVIAGDTLVAERLDDTTLRVDIPSLKYGTYPVLLVGTGFEKIIGDVVVHGFIESKPMPGIVGYPMVWPPTGLNPTVLTNQGNHLAFIDLRTGASFAFPDSVHDTNCADGPGPTYQWDRVLLAALRMSANGVGCVFDAWILSSDLKLTLLDTAVTYGSLGSEISPSVSMSVGAHDIWTTGGTAPFTGRYEDTRNIRLCPKANIATIVASFTHDNGLPFFDGTTGGLRFAVPELSSGDGAAFTSGCDTVYVAGRDRTDANTVLIGLTTADGQVFRADTLPTTSSDVALDPTGRWLFLASYSNAGPVILVLDRATFERLGTLAFPGQGVFAFALSGAYGRLYAFDGFRGESVAYSFDIAMP